MCEWCVTKFLKPIRIWKDTLRSIRYSIWSSKSCYGLLLCVSHMLQVVQCKYSTVQKSNHWAHAYLWVENKFSNVLTSQHSLPMLQQSLVLWNSSIISTYPDDDLKNSKVWTLFLVLFKKFTLKGFLDKNVCLEYQL